MPIKKSPDVARALRLASFIELPKGKKCKQIGKPKSKQPRARVFEPPSLSFAHLQPNRRADFETAVVSASNADTRHFLDRLARSHTRGNP